MYEFATGRWLFTPEAEGDIPCDIIHLAQMTLRTGQEHEEATLEQYELEEEQNDIKGIVLCLNVLTLS